MAVALAAVAGAVDAVAYVRLNRLFVSFMSGNTTQGMVALDAADWPRATMAALVIGLFVAGVFGGELAAGAGPRWGRPLALGSEALLLGGGAAGLAQGAPDAILLALLAVAMGMQNASVHRAGGISVSLTYVTGTLVHLGRALAETVRRKGPWSAAAPHAALWLGFAAGALAGGMAGRATAVGTLAVIAAVVLGLAASCAVPSGSGGP